MGREHHGTLVRAHLISIKPGLRNREILNSMHIRVECYAGYRGEQEPRAFWLGERRIAVVEIVDRWMAPEYRYFRVRAGDAHVYVLRSDEVNGEWTLGAFTHAQTVAPTHAG